MTGIERLRDIVDDGPYSGGMIHISVQKLREICEQIEREFGVETVKADGIAANNRRVELCAALGIDTDTGWSDAMAEMVKRLMPEGMEWPRFETGEPVHPDDRMLDKGGAMDVYVKNGWVPRFMDRTLGIQVYLRLSDGTQVVDVFNPTIKRDAGEIDFNWLLEATPENELRLLREVAHRFTAWVSMMRRDADALAERERSE